MHTFCEQIWLISQFFSNFVNLDNNSALSPLVLKQLCDIFDGLTNSEVDTNNIQLLTSKVNELQQNDPQFYNYLLCILSNDEFSTQQKLLSLIIIFRSSVNKYLNDAFMHESISLFEELLLCQIPELSRFSAAIICSYISNFGEEVIPDFFSNNIIQMMQNPETIEAAFYTLEEFSQGSIKIPKEIRVILSNYVDAENPYHFNALSIFNNIIDDCINFVHEIIIPIILNSYESYEFNSLAKSATIAATTFVHFPDSIIGDFIANCLLLELPPDDSYVNIIDDQLVSTLFEKEEWIQPYHPIIFALVTKLKEQDDDISSYGICSMSQSILMSMFDSNPEITGSIIIDSISKAEEDGNNGLLFRCLSIIISDREISEQFIPVIFNEIESGGDYRSDAVLCLSRYCEVNNDSAEIIDKSLSTILPLLGDADNSDVRCQSIVAIQNILGILDDSFQPNVEHVEFLVELLKIPELSTDFVLIADLVDSYLKFFPSFDEFSEESNEDSFFVSFFNDVVEFFLNEEESNPLFVSFTSILSTFMSKIPDVSNFESIISEIYDKILLIFSDSDFTDDSDIDEKYYCLVLLESIFISYQQIDENRLAQIVDILIQIIRLQIQNQLLVQKAFELSLIFYQLNAQLMMSDQLVSFYLESCSEYLSAKNQEIAYIVAQILQFLIPKMDFQQMQIFLKKCTFFIRLYADRSSTVFHLGHQLYHILEENGQEIDSFIVESFHHSCGHCSCDES